MCGGGKRRKGELLIHLRCEINNWSQEGIKIKQFKIKIDLGHVYVE